MGRQSATSKRETGSGAKQPGSQSLPAVAPRAALTQARVASPAGAASPASFAKIPVFLPEERTPAAGGRDVPFPNMKNLQTGRVDDPPEGSAGKAEGKLDSKEASASMHAGLMSPGQPLDSATKAFFEPRFGHDFSQVRVHTNARAAEAARLVHALAFTTGPDVVFGAGQHSPHTEPGRRLLAHELAHVVQQSGNASYMRPGSSSFRAPFLPVSQPGDPAEGEADAASAAVLDGRAAKVAGGSQPLAIHREPDPKPAPVPEVKPETLIQQWLEQHQFAPPAQQADEGERHVLLNGEDMGISDAVKLAAAALSQPPELVKSVITAKLAPPVAASSAPLPFPFPGPKNEIGGLSLSRPRDAFGLDPSITKTVEFSTIDDYLTAHGFAAPEIRDPTGSKVLFDGKETTVEVVADRALAILGQYPALKKPDVLAHIRQKYVAARGGAGTQIIFGYTLVPKLSQFVGGPADPNNPLRTQHQFSFTITRQHHANDSPGLETSFQGSVTLTDAGIQNVQAGGQEAIVKPLLQGWIQISGLIQVMASANWSKSATGSTVVSPALQATAGGQILLTPAFRGGDYAFLNGHVQLGVQVLGGTQTSSAGTVGVANAGLVLNIPF